MKQLCTFMILLLLQVSILPIASARDFDWLNNLNIKAEADSSGYRVRLATRFRIGDAEVKTIIGNVERPSDAYMVLRLGELSHRPVDEVLNLYQSNRKRGWGSMARSLGIKPGSREFHALKRGHDLNGDMGAEGSQYPTKGKGKSNNKNKGKK